MTARKPRTPAAMPASAAPRSAVPVVAAKASDEKIRCEAVANSGSSSLVALSTSSTTGMPRAAAARQIGATNAGNRLSTSSTSMSATSAAASGGVAPSRPRPCSVATIFSPSRSMKIPDTEIEPPSTQNTPDGSTPVFASASRKRRLASSVPTGPENRARPPSRATATAALAAQPPVVATRSRGAHLGARRRKSFDLEQEIFHRDAGAQHHRRALRSCQAKSTPFSTHSRMM